MEEPTNQNQNKNENENQNKNQNPSKNRFALQSLEHSDPQIHGWIKGELLRQQEGLEMIASENYVSPAVLEAQGSILTNKYAEGYPRKRYYGGCKFVDSIEQLAIDRLKKLFCCSYANVQPHSGSQANMAVFLSALEVGDKFLGMDLSHGGHLTHGSKVNFSGFLFKASSYQLDPYTGLINYEKIRQLAKEIRPKLLLAGYSAYPRRLDFVAFKEIAEEVGALFMVDMAHFAGLVAAELHPSPLPHADFVTSTTHKTLRGPRGGIILCQSEEHFKKINSKIFPGIQGGPLEHIIAAKAVAFKEALSPEFKIYVQKVLENAKILAESFLSQGFTLVTGGTDNHLLLLDLTKHSITGKDAEKALEEAGITTNKNTIPGEIHSPFVTSGLRLGTPALTTRGMGPQEMKSIALWIGKVLQNPENPSLKQSIQKEVQELCKQFPIY